MGVKTLWSVLDCCGERLDLRDLRGQTLAVDLAGWVVQDNQCRAMSGGRVAKPHLRNVFFRAAALASLGIRPVFVLDGAAPELKRDTMNARSNAEGEGAEVKSLNRGRLRAVMGECRFLLSAMGFQCLQAKNEGEEMCAQLNRSGLADAVVTDDSDVFCYGARTVIRNFTITSGSLYTIERFDVSKIEQDLGLTRDRLVVMAVLLGCDFFPAGVSGVGKETVMQLFGGWKRCWSALDVVGFWIRKEFADGTESCRKCSEMSHCRTCVSWMDDMNDKECLCAYLDKDKKLAKVENAIKKKCRKIEIGWWLTEYPKIVGEFEAFDESEATTLEPISCPKVFQCMSILVKKLAWTEEYSRERLVPLFARWQIEKVASTSSNKVLEIARPVRIVKKRVVNSVSSLSIEWKVVEGREEEAKGLPDTFESVEPAELVSKAYPDIYGIFEAANVKKTTRQPKAKKAEKENAAAMATQKPITQFFTQQKVKTNSTLTSKIKATSSASPLKPPIPNVPEETSKKDFSEMKDRSDSSCIVLSDSECSADLSAIIDDILSKKVGNMSVDEGKNPEIMANKVLAFVPSKELDFVTSTPAPKKTKAASLVVLREKTALSDITKKGKRLTTKVMESLDDEAEDSFDRMCK